MLDTSVIGSTFSLLFTLILRLVVIFLLPARAHEGRIFKWQISIQMRASGGVQGDVTSCGRCVCTRVEPIKPGCGGNIVAFLCCLSEGGTITIETVCSAASRTPRLLCPKKLQCYVNIVIIFKLQRKSLIFHKYVCTLTLFR